MNEKVVYSGKIFEIINVTKKIGNKEINLEIARRSPGVRVLIVKKNKILLAQEYRQELKGYDYRLPGGKVCDTLAEYLQIKDSKKKILNSAITAAKKECEEETGVIPITLKLLEITKAGATIEWDLYYFLIDKFSKGKQKLELGEEIKVQWFSFPEALGLCFNNQIKEDRSVGVLLKFLTQKKIS